MRHMLTDITPEAAPSTPPPKPLTRFMSLSVHLQVVHGEDILVERISFPTLELRLGLMAALHRV